MSSKKYEDLIKDKKAKLEQIRSERKHLLNEKQARAVDKEKEKPSKKIETVEDINNVCSSFGISPVPPIIELTASQYQKPDASNTPSKPGRTKDTESEMCKNLMKLSVCSTKCINIQPEKSITYNKSTQTNISRVPLKLVIGKYDDHEDEYPSEGGFISKLPPGCMSPGLPQLHFVEPAITPMEHIHEESYVEFTEEQKQAIISSTNFKNSVKRLGRIVEKIVSNNIDITKDYVRGTGYEDDADAKARGRVALNHIFFDDQWSKNRCVTDMDWSTYYPEMLVASYHINENEPLEPDGIVMVWNTSLKKHTPEYVFHSPSSVMSTCFAKFNPNLIFGGTYSGQIVVWDTRSPKPVPVQSTNLNCGAHVQPVHSLQIVGDENSQHMISISSDGKLCSWSLDMFSGPVDILTLEKSQKKPVAATCMAVPTNEDNILLAGSEDGCIYLASRSGFNPGVNNIFETHDAPITGISMHHTVSSLELGHLFLTSSIDMTTKLWSLNTQEPVHTFKYNYDYVMDVAWSPVHPALFAAVDGSGHLDLWNLNVDIEEPIISFPAKGQPAFNRISWMPNGQHIAAGDVDGKIYLHGIADSISQPLPDESLVLSNNLKGFRNDYF